MAKITRGAPRRNNPNMTTRSSIRARPEERQDWGRRADSAGLNFSDWARRMIRIALGQAPVRPGDSNPKTRSK